MDEAASAKYIMEAHQNGFWEESREIEGKFATMMDGATSANDFRGLCRRCC